MLLDGEESPSFYLFLDFINSIKPNKLVKSIIKETVIYINLLVIRPHNNVKSEKVIIIVNKINRIRYFKGVII